MTPEMQNRINEAVTFENAFQFERTTDKLVFCADCLGVTLTRDSGENAALELENRFERFLATYGDL